jgi:hypothetical protein
VIRSWGIGRFQGNRETPDTRLTVPADYWSVWLGAGSKAVPRRPAEPAGLFGKAIGEGPAAATAAEVNRGTLDPLLSPLESVFCIRADTVSL